MKRLVAMLLCCVLAFSMTGCGNKGDDTQKDSQSESTNTQPESQPENSENNTQTGGDALSLMTTVWDNFPEDNKFACFGGNQTEDAVQGAAGKFDVSDTDGMTYTLLIPADVQANVDDAASLIHLMNANTFTSAAVHVTNGDAAGAADKIKDTIKNNQFMCGFPEKIAIITAGDYVMYAFGAGDLIDSFVNIAGDKINGATVVCNETVE